MGGSGASPVALRRSRKSHRGKGFPLGALPEETRHKGKVSTIEKPARG